MNITLLLASVKGLWGNKVIRYFLMSVIFVLILFLSLHIYGNNRYQDGVAYQKNQSELVQQKLKLEYDKKLDEANSKMLDLNAEIVLQKAEYLKLKLQNQQKTDKIKEEVRDYGKTTDGAKRCVGSEWVRVYKNSLPN